eukprot:PhM_4_TR9644/c0_g1_i1/m.105615
MRVLVVSFFHITLIMVTVNGGSINIFTLDTLLPHRLAGVSEHGDFLARKLTTSNGHNEVGRSTVLGPKLRLPAHLALPPPLRHRSSRSVLSPRPRHNARRNVPSVCCSHVVERGDNIVVDG